MKRILTAEQKQLGLLRRILRYFFGVPRKRSNGEIRKGKLQSKRVWGIMLIVAIPILQLLGQSDLIGQNARDWLILVGAMLTTIGIQVHKVKTYGLSDIFGELK